MSEAENVTAIVCTLNSIETIERCLRSLRENRVGEILVVDGGSVDGTCEIAKSLADRVLRDDGVGLAAARNVGIIESSQTYVLNAGSDNVFPQGSVDEMVNFLISGSFDGVSAQTIVSGNRYWERALDLHRRGRYLVGPTNVIGTPSLFLGERLRNFPFDPARRFSDDSELCERWGNEWGARFAISDAEVLEIGKASLLELRVRGRMYGYSDFEVYRAGKRSEWTARRKVKSIFHPIRVDFLVPLKKLSLWQFLVFLPGFFIIAVLRYLGWISAWFRNMRKK